MKILPMTARMTRKMDATDSMTISAVLRGGISAPDIVRFEFLLTIAISEKNCIQLTSSNMKRICGAGCPPFSRVRIPF